MEMTMQEAIERIKSLEEQVKNLDATLKASNKVHKKEIGKLQQRYLILQGKYSMAYNVLRDLEDIAGTLSDYYYGDESIGIDCDSLVDIQEKLGLFLDMTNFEID